MENVRIHIDFFLFEWHSIHTYGWLVFIFYVCVCVCVSENERHTANGNKKEKKKNEFWKTKSINQKKPKKT